MQLQNFLEKSKKDDFGYSANFRSYFGRNLFSNYLYAKSPQAIPHYELGTSIPNPRERYRARLIGKIAGLEVSGKDHLKRYIRYKFRTNCRPNTIRGAMTTGVIFLKFIQNHTHHSLETLKRSDIELFVEFEQDRGMSAVTLQTRLNNLYAFIRFLADEGVMQRDLLKRKIHIKQPVRLPKSINLDDEQRILSQIDKVRDKAMILLLLRTGMRIGELLKTEMDDINLEGQQIRINESEKTGTGRVVFFTNDAAEALYHWLMERDYWKKYLFHGRHDKPISYATAWSTFKEYVARAGLSHKGITLHCLRHTYATNLLNARIPIEVLRDLLGHKSLELTRRYANLTDTTRKEEYFRAMAIIEGRNNN